MCLVRFKTLGVPPWLFQPTYSLSRMTHVLPLSAKLRDVMNLLTMFNLKINSSAGSLHTTSNNVQPTHRGVQGMTHHDSIRMWAVGMLALGLVLGAATLISSSAVLQLQKDNFQVHLESQALVLVECKWSLILSARSLMHFLKFRKSHIEIFAD
jgi:hypothetical protein